ncbi:MAG: flavodoxin family protein [Anaerolineae bacterium]|nr:flavodoxin family protein [Anaerolineae bacterium]
MGNVLVQYYSQTGRTAEMAELVAKGAASVPGIEVRLRTIEESTIDDLFWCDGLALGAPTHLGSIPWRVKQWWDEATDDAWMQIDGKFGCAFSSAGGLGGGPEIACLGLLTMLMNYGLLVFGITDYVAPLRTLHYGAALPGRPKTQAEKDICERLGRRLAEWVSFYVDGVEQYHPRHATYPRRG